ncbi:MAG: ATP-binding protein [Candidatus Thorarchaeota archaeon SMTZ1-83]
MPSTVSKVPWSIKALMTIVNEIFAHYKIVRELGRGGMATVYEAVDVANQKPVALKMLFRHLSSDQAIRTRFLREAKAGMILNHPGIVKVYEVGEEKAQPFIAMELVEGKTLDELMRDEGLCIERIVDIGAKVADALIAAHAEKIVHRDIKPRNIMVSDGDVKVMDFGLVKILDSPAITEKYEIVGTLHYMSPQQAIGIETDERSDIFSLGVVLYQLLTGSLPYEGDHPGALIHSILYSDPSRMDELRSGIPPELEQVVFKALQKQPQDRYRSAAEFKSDLEGVRGMLRGKTVTLTAGEEVFEQSVRGIYSGFVGRKQELRVLENHFREMLKGQGSTVLVTGEAGIGKSRLVWELGREAKKERARYMVARCFLGPEGVPYQPILEVVHSYLELKGAKDSVKLYDFIEKKAPHLAQRKEVVEALLMRREKEASLISREQVWDTIVELLKVMSRDRPIVLHIDDLHWADLPTLNLLAYLTRRIRQERVLIVGTYRPEELTEGPRPHRLLPLLERMGKEGLYEEIRLERLDEEGTRGVTYSVFPRSEFSESFIHLIYKETEGNPLFVLEILQLLQKEGVIYEEERGWRLSTEVREVAVPSKVSEVIVNRLKKLDPEEKILVEVASVEGRSFHSDTLCACLGLPRLKVLLTLQDLEQSHHLIYASEKEYRFDHGKIREVIYDRLMPELKKEYHKRIGEHFRVTFGEREEYSGKIAYHLMEADEQGEALPYLVKAGEHAKRLFANEEAIGYFDKGIDLVEQRLNRDRTRDLLQAKLTFLRGKADVQELIGRYDEARGNYEELASLAQELDDQRERAYGIFMEGVAFRKEGKYRRALECHAQALEIQRRVGDTLGQAKTLNCIGNALYYSGEYEEALSNYFQSLRIQKEIGNTLGVGNALNNIGNVHYDRGEYDEALSYHSESLSIQRQMGSKLGEGNGLNNIGNVHYDRGEYEDALRCYAQSLTIQRQIGNKLGEGDALSNLAQVHYDRAEYQDALHCYEESLSIHRQIGHEDGEWESQHRLSRLWLEMGDRKKTLEKLEETIRISKTIGTRQRRVWSHIDSGLAKFIRGAHEDALLDVQQALVVAKETKEIGAIMEGLRVETQIENASGHTLQALQHAQEALSLAMEKERKPDVAQTRLLLAWVYLLKGDLAEAEDHARQVVDIAGACGMREHLRQACHYLGKIFLMEKDYSAARKELERAEDIVETISSNLSEELRKTYCAKAELTELRKDLKISTSKSRRRSRS